MVYNVRLWLLFQHEMTITFLYKLMFHCAHPVSRNDPGSVLVPLNDGDGESVIGALLVHLVLGMVVGGDLPGPPANGYDLLVRMPLHALCRH